MDRGYPFYSVPQYPSPNDHADIPTYSAPNSASDSNPTADPTSRNLEAYYKLEATLSESEKKAFHHLDWSQQITLVQEKTGLSPEKVKEIRVIEFECLSIEAFMEKRGLAPQVVEDRDQSLLGKISNGFGRMRISSGMVKGASGY